jgi:hypothetical protein
MNGVWIAVIDRNKNCFLANVYTRQEIDIPLPGNFISIEGDLRLWVIPHIDDRMPNVHYIHMF